MQSNHVRQNMISSQKDSDNCSFSYMQKNRRVRYKTSRCERTHTQVSRRKEGVNKKNLCFDAAGRRAWTRRTLSARSFSLSLQQALSRGDDGLLTTWCSGCRAASDSHTHTPSAHTIDGRTHDGPVYHFPSGWNARGRACTGFLTRRRARSRRRLLSAALGHYRSSSGSATYTARYGGLVVPMTISAAAAT